MGDVSVIGSGYVGLTTAVCLAHLGHNVVAADIDATRVELLNEGQVPMFEARMDQLLAEGLANGRLRFVSDSAQAVEQSHFHFMCLPTPQGANGEADLDALDAAMEELGDAFPTGSIVILKSTVPVGTADEVRANLLRPDVAVVSCPEFLREGTAINDFLSPDRIVVGSTNDRAATDVAALFATLDAPVLTMSNRSAEAVKYSANAFLATKLSFINSIARICEAVDADVLDVVAGMGTDNRISAKFLQPGPGWGGSCFPKDVAALSHLARSVGAPAPLLDAVLTANNTQISHVTTRIIQALGPRPVQPRIKRESRVGVWGLTFKANTSDRRDSPALEVVRRLQASGLTVQAFDPTVTEPITELPDLMIAGDPYEAAAGCDVLVILTEWEEFVLADLEKTAEVMRVPRMLDARNIFAADTSQLEGFAYSGVGR